jgi:hypothetical protein
VRANDFRHAGTYFGEGEGNFPNNLNQKMDPLCLLTLIFATLFCLYIGEMPVYIWLLSEKG